MRCADQPAMRATANQRRKERLGHAEHLVDKARGYRSMLAQMGLVARGRASPAVPGARCVR